MSIKLIPHADWMKHTNAPGFKRSKELLQLDIALLAHERSLSSVSIQVVQKKFDVWKKSQGPGQAWKTSRRNKDKYVDLLATLLEKGADSDSAWGTTPNFMHESLVHSRLGVLYLFGHLKADPKVFNVLLEGGLSLGGGLLSGMGSAVKDGGLGSTHAKNIALAKGPVMVAGGPLIAAGRSTDWKSTRQFSGQPGAMAQFTDFMRSIEAWFREIAAKLIAEFKAKWKFELPVQTVNAAVNTVCSAVGAGIVSAGLDTAKGAVVTADAVFTRVRAWRLSKDVEFASGHPSMVVNTIHRAMSASIGEGMWQMLQGVAGMGLTAASMGAGMIVSMVVAAVEMLAKLFWRLYEVTQMNKFFGEAAEHWRNRDTNNALHKQPFAFARWYRKHVLLAPALAILTLNSGICGDKMIYLSMFNDDQTPISSDEFSRGTASIENLKVWGARYLGDCGFSFSSENDTADRLLTFAQGSGAVDRNAAGNEDAVVQAHQANLTGGAKVWDKTVRVMS